MGQIADGTIRPTSSHSASPAAGMRSIMVDDNDGERMAMDEPLAADCGEMSEFFRGFWAILPTMDRKAETHGWQVTPSQGRPNTDPLPSDEQFERLYFKGSCGPCKDNPKAFRPRSRCWLAVSQTNRSVLAQGREAPGSRIRLVRHLTRELHGVSLAGRQHLPGDQADAVPLRKVGSRATPASRRTLAAGRRLDPQG